MSSCRRKVPALLCLNELRLRPASSWAVQRRDAVAPSQLLINLDAAAVLPETSQIDALELSRLGYKGRFSCSYTPQIARISYPTRIRLPWLSSDCPNSKPAQITARF